ncbi:hypothetical protein Tco_1240274, partial [Tanacetum coccineum]
MSQPANDEFSQHLSDDEASNHEDASDTGAAPKQQQQVIPQTTAISNIKLPILKKEEYDIWAMEMEHYLEYINNDVWKVIQNGNSKKRISTRKDGVIRILSPITAAEIQAAEKERKAKNILLMAIPKEHMRRFHGIDDAKEIWEAIRTSSEGLEKGYDIFQQLLSQLEAHGAEVSTEDANHKFLRSLPPAWSNLPMTMRTKPDVDTLSIDDLYNNLRVFEQEIQGASKTSSSAQNVTFVSQSKSSTNKVKSGFTGAYNTCTPSTSSTNIPEKEVLVGFADEVIYSLFAKQSEDWDLLHEDLEQIDDVDIEEMDINWHIAMIAIRMKKFYDKKCFKCHNTSNFAWNVQQRGHRSVQINAGRPNISTVRPNINTSRTNINFVRPNINTGRTNINHVRPRVNTGSSNVNTVRTRQSVPTKISNSFSPKRPQEHPLKNMVDRGIFDSGCSGHMTGNKDQLEDFEEFNGGSVTFGGSKGYISSTSQTTKSNASEEKDEEVELIVVPSAKKDSSTNTLKDNPKIQAFRKELEEIALKHLGTVLENNSISTPSVNTGSQTVNTGRLDLDDSPMPELEIFHKSKIGIFDEASYDEEGVITGFNCLPIEIEVSPTPTLRIHKIHLKSQILGDPKSA